MTITDTHIKLRQATTAADLEIIRDLILAVGLSTERRFITATLEGCTYWIADLDGHPAGCIGLEYGEGLSLLRSASVLPQSRRRGIGRALARSALAQASLRGDRTVYLFSSDAGPFWEDFGFVEVSPQEVANALPHTQVRGGLSRGWLHHEKAYKLQLQQAGHRE